MGLSTFQGPIRSLGGVFTQGPGSMVNITANTTLDPITHGGKILRLNNATATITLPAVNVTADPNQSGPGADPNTLNNQGVLYTIVVETASTSAKVVTNQTDTFIGTCSVTNAAAGGVIVSSGAGTAKNINLNGTTTGGVVGSVMRIYAETTNRYMVEGVLIGSGTVATPFS